MLDTGKRAKLRMSQGHRLAAGRRRKLLLSLSSLLSLSISLNAYAGPDTLLFDPLQEIVVTATKRAENIQQVPLPITTLDGRQLAQLGVQNPFDLALYTPALRVESVEGLVQPRFNLRGLGTDEYTANAQGSVGVYVDEVFLNGAAAQGLNMFDLEKVEVLRGPQGTLWGMNTTAGAITFTPRAPTEQSSGYATVSYGNFDSRTVEAAIGGPLVSDRLLGRVSVMYDSFGGYVRNSYLGTIDNSNSQAAARVQLLWKLGDSGTLKLTGHEANLHQVVPTFHAGYGLNGQAANGIGTNNDRYQVAEDGRGLGTLTSSGGQAKLNWAFPNEWRLTNIVAIEQNTLQGFDDDDATPIVVSNEGQFSSAQQESDEFRLTSPDDRPVTFIAGVFGLYEFLKIRYPLPQFETNTQSSIFTRNYAGFASATVRFENRLTARAGVRYTYENKSIEQFGVIYTPSPVDQYNAALSTTPLVPFLNFNDSKAWKQTTGDASLDYRISDSAMLYARVAKGFRGGTYNTAITGPNQQGSVDPETLIDYELGAKTQELDRRVTINAAAFLYEYRDLQVFLLQTIGAKLQNAATARVAGLEFEASASPSEQWLLHLYGSWIDATYTSFPNASVPTALSGGQPVNLSGQPLERAPRDTAGLSVRYSYPALQGTVSLETDWRYTGKVIFAPWVGSGNLQPVASLAPDLQRIFNLTTQKPVTTGNARIAYAAPGGRLEIAAWAKNLTNAQYKTNMFNLVFNRSAGIQWNNPLTYGMTVSFNFGDR
jgi:iron complex outermembrane recepter protein